MNTHGFTLLEVTLFLAITGLVGLIAFAGLGPRFRNVRFTDSVRSLESSIQKNLLESVARNSRQNPISCEMGSANSINIITGPTSTSSRGEAEQCVMNGRVAIFDRANKRVIYRPIVSLRKGDDSADCGSSTVLGRLQKCFRSRILDDTTLTNVVQQPAATYSYANELQQQTALFGIGYAIEPLTGETFNFWYNGLNTNGLYLHNTLTTFNSLQSVAKELCVNLSGRNATIVFNRTLTPETKFDQGCS